MQGMSGLSALNQPQGLAPAAGPAAAGLQGLQNDTLSTITQDLPNNWLSPDLKSGTIDWSMFAPINIPDYHKVLNSSYRVAPKLPTPAKQYSGFADYVTNNRFNTPAPVRPGFVLPDLVAEQPKPRPSSIEQIMGNRNGPNGGGIMGILYNQEKNRYDQSIKNFSSIDPNAISFNDPKIDAAIKALRLNTGFNGTNLDEGNRDLRDKRFAEVSSSTGMSIDDLYNYSGIYDKAYRTLSDPVGANWQDVKNTGKFYTDTVLPSIRKYSGYTDGYFNNLDSMASEGTRNSQKYLSPEYYALHTTSPSVANLGAGVRQGTMIGNTNPKAPKKSGWSPFTSYHTSPYAQTDWLDFLDPSVSRVNVTPEQKAEAEARQKAQMKLMNSPVSEGGQFNLWKETGVDPYKVTKVKGGKWVPQNSGYTNQLNVAQNYLPFATSGEKTYKDAGFDENEAYKSGFRFEKKKKKFGVLGGILKIASLLPTPIQPFAQAANAVYSLANKDYLGAVMSGLGAYGKFTGTNPMGSVTDSLVKAGLSPTMANAAIGAGIGGLGALQNKGNVGLGILGGGLGSYTSSTLGGALANNGLSPELSGAISGGAGSAVNGLVLGAKGVPLLANTATGAVSGYNRGKDIRRKQDKQSARK